jgi:DNA-binding winged helix-turn-helix (wHTH) protein
MGRPAVNPNTVQFGLFEVDLQTRELRKSGMKIKLNDQPFQVLALLLERPGEIVTREELQTRLWPADTFVDFDLSLNSAVKKLRQALGDESDNPRFVETLYRRGYRFIAPISNHAPHAGDGTGPLLVDSVKSKEPAARSWKRLALITAGCVVVLLAALVFKLTPRSSPRILGFTQITSGGKVHQLGALATDGQRLYFQASDRNRIALDEVSVSGGDSVLIPTPLQNTFLGDIAPDGSSLMAFSVSSKLLITRDRERAFLVGAPLAILPALVLLPAVVFLVIFPRVAHGRGDWAVPVAGLCASGWVRTVEAGIRRGAKAMGNLQCSELRSRAGSSGDSRLHRLIPRSDHPKNLSAR